MGSTAFKRGLERTSRQGFATAEFSRTVNGMKVVKMADEKIGLVVLLPNGAHAIDIASSLGVFSDDPLSNGLLNGVLKDGHDWSLLVKHWAHLRSPLKRLQNAAARNPDHPCLVLHPLKELPRTASAGNPIVAIEITDIETVEEQDPTGRRAMERQFMRPPENEPPGRSRVTRSALIIDFPSTRGDAPSR
jgi:hypothetical protein